MRFRVATYAQRSLVGNRADKMRHPGAVYKIPSGAHPGDAHLRRSVVNFTWGRGLQRQLVADDKGRAAEHRLPVWLLAILFARASTSDKTLCRRALLNHLHGVTYPATLSIFLSTYFCFGESLVGCQ